MRADLPPELTAALARESHGLSRSDAARRAGTMSDTYRSGGGSAVIAEARDALAYALVRMPATLPPLPPVSTRLPWRGRISRRKA